MKKTKGKSEQKTDKKAEKKDAKKVARKELSSNLSAKFKEVIQSLGHEAEVIAKDIEKAGKFLSKKLSDKKIKKNAASSSLIKTLDSAIAQVKDQNPESGIDAAKGDVTSDKPKTASTRRKTVAAGAEAPQSEPARKTRAVRKPSQPGTEKVSASTTRRKTKPVADSPSNEAGSKPVVQNEGTNEQ